MRIPKLRTNTYTGKLIAFEGTDGAGKTTMIAWTEKWLKEKLGEDHVVIVKQPTDLSRKTKLFQKMMYCPSHDDIDYRAVQLLTMSDRMQHGFEVIEPLLRKGKIVICDRYIYTSLANMLARGYTRETWFYAAAKHLLKPNAVFLAYVRPELAIERILSRPSECDRHLDKKLLTEVAGQFKSMAKVAKFHVLDTSQDSAQTFEEVKQILNKERIIL